MTSTERRKARNEAKSKLDPRQLADHTTNMCAEVGQEKQVLFTAYGKSDNSILRSEDLPRYIAIQTTHEFIELFDRLRSENYEVWVEKQD